MKPIKSLCGTNSYDVLVTNTKIKLLNNHKAIVFNLKFVRRTWWAASRFGRCNKLLSVALLLKQLQQPPLVETCSLSVPSFNAPIKSFTFEYPFRTAIGCAAALLPYVLLLHSSGVSGRVPQLTSSRLPMEYIWKMLMKLGKANKYGNMVNTTWCNSPWIKPTTKYVEKEVINAIFNNKLVPESMYHDVNMIVPKENKPKTRKATRWGQMESFVLLDKDNKTRSKMTAMYKNCKP